jgi:hypothetical protein
MAAARRAVGGLRELLTAAYVSRGRAAGGNRDLYH